MSRRDSPGAGGPSGVSDVRVNPAGTQRLNGSCEGNKLDVPVIPLGCEPPPAVPLATLPCEAEPGTTESVAPAIANNTRSGTRLGRPVAMCAATSTTATSAQTPTATALRCRRTIRPARRAAKRPPLHEENSPAGRVGRTSWPSPAPKAVTGATSLQAGYNPRQQPDQSTHAHSRCSTAPHRPDTPPP